MNLSHTTTDPNEIFKNFFGGGRGFGGAFGGGGLHGDDPFDAFDEMFGRGGGIRGAFGGQQGMSGVGMGGGLGRRGPQKHVHNLNCSLSELYHGATKKLKITRQVRRVSEVGCGVRGGAGACAGGCAGLGG